MERRTKSGIIIPSNVSGVRTVKFRCFLCDDLFYDDEERAWQQHVARCAREHEASIHAASPRNQLGAFSDPSMWDTEYDRWAKGPNGDWEPWRKDHKIDPALLV
jgi:hypothetical protein